jgi:hypothetical protein
MAGIGKIVISESYLIFFFLLQNWGTLVPGLTLNNVTH